MKTLHYIFSVICLCLMLTAGTLKTNAQAITDFPATFTYADDMDLTGWTIAPGGVFGVYSTIDLITPKLDLSPLSAPYIYVSGDNISVSISTDSINYIPMKKNGASVGKNVKYIKITKTSGSWGRWTNTSNFYIHISSITLPITGFPTTFTYADSMDLTGWTMLPAGKFDTGNTSDLITPELDLSGLEKPYLYASGNNITISISTDGTDYTPVKAWNMPLQSNVKYIKFSKTGNWGTTSASRSNFDVTIGDGEDMPPITEFPVIFTYASDMDFAGWTMVPLGNFSTSNTTDLITPELDLSELEKPYIIINANELTVSISADGTDYTPVEMGMSFIEKDIKYIKLTKTGSRWPRSFSILINDFALKTTPLYNTFPLELDITADMDVSDWTISGADMASSLFVVTSQIDMSALQNPYVTFTSPDNAVKAYVSEDGSEWTTIGTNQGTSVSKDVKYVMVDRGTRSDWNLWGDKVFKITIDDAWVADFPWSAECTGNSDSLKNFTFYPDGSFYGYATEYMISPMLDLSDVENPVLATAGYNVEFSISTDGENFTPIALGIVPIESDVKFVKIVKTGDNWRWDWGMDNSYFAMRVTNGDNTNITEIPYSNDFASMRNIYGFTLNNARFPEWYGKGSIAFNEIGGSVTLPELNLPIDNAYKIELIGNNGYDAVSPDAVDVQFSTDGIEYQSSSNYVFSAAVRFIRIVATAGNVGIKEITIDSYKPILPPITHFYDFEGTGNKAFVNTYHNKSSYQNPRFEVSITNDYFNGFSIKQDIGVSTSTVAFSINVSDINRDGFADISVGNVNPSIGYAGPDTLFLSNADGTYRKEAGFFVPGSDLNMDGRIDLLRHVASTQENYIRYQKPNGEFSDVYMRSMTPEEYTASFDQEAYEAYLQAVQAGRRPSLGPGFGLSGISRPVPIIANPDDMQKPTDCLDLNGDGIPDLLGNGAGIGFFGTGEENRYIASMVGNRVTARDLNNDGFTDFVIWNETEKELQTHVYRGNGEYDVTVLMSDIVADKKVYCHDFDGDGDVDILATFSYPYNKVGSFWVFAENDGNANFTVTENGTADKYIFSACRDIDNDGYYDLILIDATDLDASYNRVLQYGYSEPMERLSINSNPAPIKVMWGQANLTLSKPELLYEAEKHTGSIFPRREIVNIADIDNDGQLEIWFTEGDHIHKVETSDTLVRPTAPAAPTFVFDAATGRLDINWKAGSDTKVSACDLTYALRIGTQPGLGDVLYADANADGSRRNFADGNMSYNRSKILDVSTWAPGNYYIAVQTINPNHIGSEWSIETTFQNSYLSSSFTTDKQSLAFCDSLTVYYTPLPEGYTLHWDFDGAQQLASSANGLIYLKWATGGTKTISLQIETPDGTLSETTEKTIDILSNKITATEGAGSERAGIYESWFADWNLDGTQDMLYSTRYDLKGLHKNDGNGNFSSLLRVFNTYFKPNLAKWMDWDMDGVVDLFYKEDGAYGYLKNTGNDNFTKTAITLQTDAVENGSYLDNLFVMADLDHDGNLDPIGLQYYYENGNQKSGLIKNEGNGVFSSAYLPDYEALGTYAGLFVNTMDWNRDGYLDYYWFTYTSWHDGNYNYSYAHSGIKLLINQGGFNFEYKYIPFQNEVITGSYWADYQSLPIIADLDNDGYIDIAYTASEKRVQILRNVNNEYFEEGDAIIIDNDAIAILASGSGYYNPITLGDLDNNGYLDILLDVKVEGQTQNIYVVYNDGNGSYRQGFISDIITNMNYGRINKNSITDVNADGIPDIYLGNNYKDDEYLHYDNNITHAVNTAPQAPTGLIATQTDDYLIIEWNDAVDNETPGVHMKYNLSVKKKGATGAGSYIISPLNGGSSTAAALPSPKGGLNIQASYDYYASRQYLYPTATRYEIPLSALPVGEIEISVQAIDLWDAVSPFSEVLTKKIENTASFKMPVTACFGSPTEIIYSGAQGGAETPVWNFDGGIVVSGSGYGPYQVQWNSDGIKNISLTLGEVTTTSQIKVLPELSAEFVLTDNVFYKTDMEMTLPNVSPSASFHWELSGYSSGGTGIGGGTVVFLEHRITAKPGNQKGILHVFGGGERYRELTLTVTQNGCESSFTKGFNVVPAVGPPAIDIVYPSANKNTISWNSSSLPTNTSHVIIYKEGNAINDFREIGRVNSTETEFTDLTSNNTVKSERYVISALLNSGVESAKSEIHQTMHLTINRGMNDNQWNLIWAPYRGREISSYRILRGSSSDDLDVLATISGASLSYTDNAIDVNAPYYAIEFLPVEKDYSPIIPPLVKGTKNAKSSDGYVRSNVVHTSDVRSIVYMSSLNILTVESDPVLSESQPSIYLYTEIFPTNTTYQNIVWSIENGGTLASIDQNGKLQAKGAASGGTVTVRATAVDGSGITNTRDFTVNSFAVLSDNANLSYLNTSEGTLSPSFSVNTLNYSVEVPYSVATIEIYAGAEDSKASISGTGSKTLVVGNNTAYVTVTAENGDYKTYIIDITRMEYVASSNGNLASLTVSAGTLAPNFNANTHNYTVEVPYSVSQITINATAEDSKASVTGIGNKNLNVGLNDAYIIVTAENGDQIQYKIEITRKERVLSNDASLKNITIAPGALQPAFSPTTTSYTVMIEPTVTSININAETNHAAATVTGTGNQTVTMDGETFVLHVTAEDGTTTKDYAIRVEFKVGINEITKEQDYVKVYPVPTNGILHVDVSPIITEPQIKVYHIDGRLLLDTKNTRIDLSDYAGGIYVIDVNGIKKKIIKM
ncbi:FG-GAP-like repeat-containing protein [Bacteroidales bacterium OttesenSCG-928-B11]|nr:FG-GAP-like repeat-containing protein [Bacteroidales bacterium OttesenSCG-928-B11]